ncbi:hypothetical protein [Streptomyces sp. NPDC001315]|uniref:hypothetical protein n=1 Tax=Streptomyces sp. NPDC001315 TaxID=3364562 RepID=UPI0036BBAA79
MAKLMATATCTAFGGVLEGSGERVGQRVLLERVGFLAELSRELTGAVVASRWDEACLDVLAGGVDGWGGALPSKGWMALRRLGWPQDLTPPGGVYVSDRVRRGAEEDAARTLRLALHRRTIVSAVLATWPADPRRRTETVLVDYAETRIPQVTAMQRLSYELPHTSHNLAPWAAHLTQVIVEASASSCLPR